MTTEYDGIYEGIIEHDGRKYEFIRGSDLIKDGMFLELWDEEQNELILIAFFSDADGSFTFTAYKENLLFALVEQFIKAARARLPPINNEQKVSA